MDRKKLRSVIYTVKKIGVQEPYLIVCLNDQCGGYGDGAVVVDKTPGHIAQAKGVYKAGRKKGNLELYYEPRQKALEKQALNEEMDEVLRDEILYEDDFLDSNPNYTRYHDAKMREQKVARQISERDMPLTVAYGCDEEMGEIDQPYDGYCVEIQGGLYRLEFHLNRDNIIRLDMTDWTHPVVFWNTGDGDVFVETEKVGVNKLQIMNPDDEPLRGCIQRWETLMALPAQHCQLVQNDIVERLLNLGCPRQDVQDLALYCFLDGKDAMTYVPADHGAWMEEAARTLRPRG